MSRRRHRYCRAPNATHSHCEMSLTLCLPLYYSPGLRSKDNIESLLKKSDDTQFRKRQTIGNKKCEIKWNNMNRQKWVSPEMEFDFYFSFINFVDRCEQTAAVIIMACAFQTNWFSEKRNKFD